MNNVPMDPSSHPLIKDKMPPGVEVDVDPYKGRILRATKDYNAGEVIYAEPPLLIIESTPCLALEALDNAISDQIALGIDSAYPLVWYYMGLQTIIHEDLMQNATKEDHKIIERSGININPTWKTQAELLLFIPDKEIEEYVHLPEYGFIQTFKKNLAQLLLENDCDDSWMSVDAYLKSLTRIIDDAAWIRASLIWVYNCFQWSDDTSSVEGYISYFITSFMSHSCLPATIGNIGTDGYQTFRARRSIKKGEELTISYLNEDDLLTPSNVRRHTLITTKRFYCLCERCSNHIDRSRGIKCFFCHGGIRYLRSTAGWHAEWYSNLDGPDVPFDQTLIDESLNQESKSIAHYGDDMSNDLPRLLQWMAKNRNSSVQDQPKRMINDDHNHFAALESLLTTAIEAIDQPWLKAFSADTMGDEDSAEGLLVCGNLEPKADEDTLIPILATSMETIDMILNDSNQTLDRYGCCSNPQCHSDSRHLSESDKIHLVQHFLRKEKHALLLGAALFGSDDPLDGWHLHLTGLVPWWEVWPNKRYLPGYDALKWSSELEDHWIDDSEVPTYIQKELFDIAEDMIVNYPWCYATSYFLESLKLMPLFNVGKNHILAERYKAIFTALTLPTSNGSFYWTIENYGRWYMDVAKANEDMKKFIVGVRLLRYARQGISSLFGENFDSVRSIDNMIQKSMILRKKYFAKEVEKKKKLVVSPKTGAPDD